MNRHLYFILFVATLALTSWGNEAMSANLFSYMENHSHYLSKAVETINEINGPIDLDEYSVVIASTTSRSRANKHLQDLNRRTRFSGKIVAFKERNATRYRVIAYTSNYRSDAEKVRDELRAIYHSAWIYTKSKNSNKNSRNSISSRTSSNYNSGTSTQNNRAKNEAHEKEVKSWICGLWYAYASMFGVQYRVDIAIDNDFLIVSMDHKCVYSGLYQIRQDIIQYKNADGSWDIILLDLENRRLKWDHSTPMTKYYLK